MAKFVWKPDVVDFGYEPSTQKIKFIHEGVLVEILSYPSWIGEAVIEFDEYNGDRPAKGVITATVSNDATRHQEAGVIAVRCDTEDYLIPVVYNYDSEHIPVSDVIDTVIMMSGDEGFVGPRDRIKAQIAAKRWLQDNGGITGTNIRFSELSVDGNKIHLPGDFVSPLALYVVSPDGYLAPIYVNRDINIGQEAMQDENSFYLLDDAGYVISAHGLTPRVDNEKPFSYFGVDIGALGELGPGQKVVQIAPGKLSGNGAYRYDAANRVIIIDGPGIDKVVLEYVSDPILRHRLKMDLGKIRVHKSYQESLEAYLYYKLVEINRHVPLYEKQRALSAYKLAMKRASMRKLNVEELIQVLRGNK